MVEVAPDPSVLWVDLVTPTTSRWVDVFDAALVDARRRFRLVQATAASPEVHLLVAAFESQHLRRVAEEQRLLAMVSARAQPLEELVVVACGHSDPMPEREELAALLDHPRLVASVPRRLPFLPHTPEEFAPVCASLLLRLAVRHQLPIGPMVQRPVSSAWVDEIEGS